MASALFFFCEFTLAFVFLSLYTIYIPKQERKVTAMTKEQIFDLKGVKVTSSRTHDQNMVESQINQGH